jgi:RecA/RadA recombinase
MPPALSDSLVGWASGPVGAERKRDLREGGQAHSGHPAPRTRANDALEALLVDLGPQIQRGVPSGGLDRTDLDEGAWDPTHTTEPSEASRVCATGLSTLDARLGGGFPRGRLSEICGPPSSGRTALALMLINTTLRQGGLTGWVDLADAFDPISASASGVSLERLLWIRPRSEEEALRSCDRLLQTEGFELVVFDCVSAGSRGIHSSQRRAGPKADRRTRVGRNRVGPSGARAPSISDVAWLRLSRLAAKTRTAFVVLSQAQAPPQAQPQDEFSTTPSTPSGGDSRNASVTGSRAAIVLEMLPLGAHFVGSPSLLDSLETTAILRRHRTRPSGAEIPLSASFSSGAHSGPDPEIDPPVDRKR